MRKMSSENKKLMAEKEQLQQQLKSLQQKWRNLKNCPQQFEKIWVKYIFVTVHFSICTL
jgi:prefoldin subunit 5